MAPQIQVQRMPQLAEAVDADDDWTGVTDAATRRKRQSRLNVRAYRRRKAQAVGGSGGANNSTQRPTPACQNEPDTKIPCWIEDQQAVVHLPASTATPGRNLAKPFLPPSTGAPAQPTRIILPLSCDHLIVLLQYNLLRASLTNRALLNRLLVNYTSLDECTSLAPTVLPHPAAQHLSALPASLHPTPLQCLVPHESWIDIIPHPAIRDTLIRAAGAFDEELLWSDTIGGLFEGFPADHLRTYGIVMWHPPWDVSGWEISRGYWERWGWTLKGIEVAVLQGTNRRRRERGETELRFGGEGRLFGERAPV